MKALKQAALKEHFTFNESKCQYNRSQINLLGHLVGNGVIKPDPEQITALRKWKHLLLGRHFDLVTDQRSVSFMLDLKHASKIKNDEILRWRLELAAYDFTTIYVLTVPRIRFLELHQQQYHFHL